MVEKEKKKKSREEECKIAKNSEMLKEREKEKTTHIDRSQNKVRRAVGFIENGK